MENVISVICIILSGKDLLLRTCCVILLPSLIFETGVLVTKSHNI